MRILLAANASYVPPRGGATRSNLLWLEHLVRSGHTCRVVAASLLDDASGKRRQMDEEASHLDWTRLALRDGIEIVERSGMRVYSVASQMRQIAVLRDQIREFEPDWVLISSEDLSHVLLGEAARSAPGRTVYLAHTPQFFPFGPASWNPDAEGAALVARAAAVVAIGHHTAGYIRSYIHREVAVVHPPIYGDGPFDDFSCFERGLITIINPCAVKGISIFLLLADRFPQYAFAALPGWGTTRVDREQLERRPNVSILPNCRNINDVLSRTRVLLMPSLWYEGFGLSVMEAMLHGIPAVTSDAGGLVEAKSGTGYVVPVRPIERHEPVFDEHGLPKPVIPEPDLTPWAAALNELLGDRAVYEREAAASRAAATRFVGGLRAAQMEELLAALAPASPAAAPHAEEAGKTIANLSAAKRALLLRKLRGKASSS
ncbi:MAG: glycosyltransferase family 4 protein [Bryobacteraceae bacterium]